MLQQLVNISFLFHRKEQKLRSLRREPVRKLSFSCSLRLRMYAAFFNYYPI
jgi:hypothetical protein